MAETISITICGDGGCGKSSITLRLVRSQWTHEYDPTIEDSYSVTRNVDGLPYFLALTDTAGQEEYRGLWAATNLNSDAFLLVYDITNSGTLETLDYFLDMIDMEADNREEKNEQLLSELGRPKGSTGERSAVGMPPPIKLVAGNKCDLREERVVSAREGLEYARRRGCGFMETSAREMVNIEETFKIIVRRVVEARRQHRQQQFPPPLNPLSRRSHPSGQSGHILFPNSLLNKGQAISHSRTPPLTAEERKLSDSVPNQRDKSTADQDQWLGLGRAFSKRVAKLRKTSASALKGDASRNKGSQAGEKKEDERAVRNPQRSKSVQHEKGDMMSRYRAQAFGAQDAYGPVKASWWRRILCS